MSDDFEAHIRRLAHDLPYPPMPQARPLQQRPAHAGLWRVAAAIVLMVMFGFAVPDIRAAVFEILQIGAVTITLSDVSETGEPLRLADVSGETDLASAQARISFDVYLPPDDVPDRVYLQEDDLLILVWLGGDEIVRVLYQVPLYDWGIAKTLAEVEITDVHGHFALWGVQAHPVQFTNGREELTYFVTDHVLIWTDGRITFRLEADMTLEEARTFAESLVIYDE